MRAFRYLWVMVFLLTADVTAHADAFHKADIDRDNRISLSELLRLVQFFNMDGYGCLENSEDGYAPGPGEHACSAHTADYSPLDWQINLSELLRVIQIFNLRGYYGPVVSEDGFAPGPTGNPYLLTLENDQDGDGLTDEEEGYLQMNPKVADEDGDGIADGVGLAIRLARIIAELPQEWGFNAWVYVESSGSCETQAMDSTESILLNHEYLYNQLQSEASFLELPYGARYFLEHGSFSYHTLDENCHWKMDETARIPAHVLYYLLMTTPENLPGTHLLPVAGDSDGDYLSDAEEIAIGYAPDNPDENGNGTPDGQDLARAMSEKVGQLPVCGIYTSKDLKAKGIAKCGSWGSAVTSKNGLAEKIVTRCVDAIEWDCESFDPVLGLRGSTDFYVSAGETGFVFSSLLLQVMRLDGSFNYYTCAYGCQTHRLDVPFLYNLLNMRGEVQAPPASHLIPLTNDDDGDYLSNYEEESIGYDPKNPDENGNHVLDGIDLAHTFVEAIRALPACDLPEKTDVRSLFSCNKTEGNTPYARFAYATPPLESNAFSVCKEVLSFNCVLEDPVLGVTVPGEEYRVNRCAQGQCYFDLSADALLLHIMETEGSLGFYFEQGGEWSYYRINIPSWDRALRP